jgi:hypothetical protein
MDSGQVDLVLTPPEAIVVHCSDYRFQAAIQEFLRQGLSIRSYDLLAIPGGAHFASMGDLMPKHLKVGRQSLKFLIEFHQPQRLILIDHADCAFFKHRLAFFFSEPSLSEKQIANLRKARRVLQGWFPDVAVDAYFADARADHPVSFTKIA